MKWRPCDLEFFLHCHYACEPHPRKDSLAMLEAARRLYCAGLIVPETSLGNDYATTEKGRVWLQMMLATPMPILIEAWVDPRKENQ